MATFDLKKQLTIHDRGLLRQLLGSEPSMNAVEWDTLPKSDIAPLISAWEANPYDNVAYDSEAAPLHDFASQETSNSANGQSNN